MTKRRGAGEGHIEKIRIERMAMGERWTASDEGLLFVRESDGGKLSNHQVYYVARRAAERAGLGKVGPRILRRSMLSALAKAGVESKVRAAIGGHTKVVTDEYYREVDAAEVSDAMGHMSRILAPLAPPAGTEDEE